MNLVDLTYVREMVEFDEKAVKNVIDMFVQQISQELILLEKAIEEQDFSLIKAISHKLQSSIKILRINVLIPVLSSMEEKSEQKNLPGLKESFLHLREITYKVVEEIKEIK